MKVLSFRSYVEKYFQKTVHGKNVYAVPHYDQVQYTGNTMGSVYYESFGPQYEVESSFIRGLLVHGGVDCCNILSGENVILFHPPSHSYLEGEKQIIFLQSEQFEFLNEEMLFGAV